MNGFKLSPLLLAMAAFGAPAAVSATPVTPPAPPDAHQLGAVVHLNLTILPQAVVGVRTSERGAPELLVRGNAGVPLSQSVAGFLVRDSRGERSLADAASLQSAIAESRRAGEREIDVTVIF
ncbi:MAG: hypothetical protein JO083_06455 [Candidatus Eremiobacteraeota bacterium]|nr:hypothetical protein [Candidatus Eremiobacteraeota bacterium]